MKLLPFQLVLLISIVFTGVILFSLKDTTIENENLQPMEDSIPEELAKYNTENKYSNFEVLYELSFNENDQELFTSLIKQIKLSNQVAKELDFLLKEYETTDAFDGAMEAMIIAYEENLKLLRETQTTFDPKDQTLVKLKNEYKQILSQYTDGLRLQLSGIENGDAKKFQEGYGFTTESKENLFQLIKVINKG